MKTQAQIQGVGTGARAHPWDVVSPFKMHYSMALKHQFITGRPPLGEILYPPLKSRRVHAQVWADFVLTFLRTSREK